MAIAALYDIHGNLPALEAVLAEIRQARVTEIVVGGDVVPGPFFDQTLELLRQLEIPVRFILGNGEVAVLAVAAGTDAVHQLPERAREVVSWTAKGLRPEHRRWLAGWPKTLRIEIPGIGEVLFCHATPRDENEIFTRSTPEEHLVPVFEDLGAALVVCGHTHMPFDRRVGGTRVVNAGSVGMPFGEPGACWLLLGPGVEPRRTHYELGAAAERFLSSDYPQARELAENLLKPRSEDEMLELYARSAIGAS